VAKGDDQVLQARMALMQIFEKIQSVDKHAILYPWSAEDRKQRLPVITKPGDFPSLVSNIRSYAHHLFIRPGGGTYYPKFFVGLMEPPASIMANIGWWFKSTDQGMWQMDLQDAEETVCLGWLLYSADEFDRAALCREIWQFSGVSVALRFRDIDNGVAKDTANRTIVKALHLDINKADPPDSKKRIELMYASSVVNFPLGIKMRLVRDLKLLTNPKAKDKALSLRITQDQFLHQTETCITWEIATIDLIDKTLRTSFHAVLMNIPDPTEPAVKLFHSVNITFNRDSYIFRFHTSRSQTTRDVVAGLLVFPTGIWSGIIDPTKFHKFFLATAIEWAHEAWWDAEDKCVVTLADKELDNLLKVDPDMAFTAQVVEVDTSNLPST